MKTLTITDAKKNLGQWLAAAARGENVGIISGADIIALRKVELNIRIIAWPITAPSLPKASSKQFRRHVGTRGGFRRGGPRGGYSTG